MALGHLLELKSNGVVPYNSIAPAFIGRGLSYLLQHILTTKVDAEHIPKTRLESQESKLLEK